MALSIAISARLAVRELHEIFAYDARSGMLSWKKPESGRKSMIGNAVGYVRHGGYRLFDYRGQSYSVHATVWAMHHGEWSTSVLDHIDGNPMNNRIENLREATAAQNSQNSRMRRNNSSGRKGVSWHKGVKKWVAQITAFGEPHHLGSFESKDDAAAAYDKAAAELHGEFARTNGQIDAEKKRHKNVFTGKTHVRMFHPRYATMPSIT